MNNHNLNYNYNQILYQILTLMGILHSFSITKWSKFEKVDGKTNKNKTIIMYCNNSSKNKPTTQR